VLAVNGRVTYLRKVTIIKNNGEVEEREWKEGKQEKKQRKIRGTNCQPVQVNWA
jgi:hypothetical protein